MSKGAYQISRGTYQINAMLMLQLCIECIKFVVLIAWVCTFTCSDSAHWKKGWEQAFGNQTQTTTSNTLRRPAMNTWELDHCHGHLYSSAISLLIQSLISVQRRLRKYNIKPEIKYMYMTLKTQLTMDMHVENGLTKSPQKHVVNVKIASEWRLKISTQVDTDSCNV